MRLVVAARTGMEKASANRARSGFRRPRGMACDGAWRDARPDSGNAKFMSLIQLQTSARMGALPRICSRLTLVASEAQD